MNRRRLALLGIALFGVGLALALAPGVGAALGGTDAVLVAIGIAAIGLGAVEAAGRREVAFEPTEPDPVEEPQPLATPGQALDEAVEYAHVTGIDEREAGEGLRERLRPVAVATLTRHGGYTREEAVAALEDGSWSDDRFAAAFFADASSRERIVERSSLLGGETTRREAEHAIDELAALAGVDE